MPSRAGRVTETDVAIAVLKVLENRPSGEASIAQLKKRIPDYLRLHDADREQSVTRPREEMWEQQVRNIVSHRESDGNFINDGLLAYRPRHLAITDAGRAYLKRRA